MSQDSEDPKTDVFQRVLAGELDVQDPEAQAFFRERPERLAELTAMLALSNDLDSFQADSEDVIAEALEGVTPRDREFVHDALDSNAGRQLGPIKRPFWVHLPVQLGAAAAGIALVAFLALRGTEEAPLGSGILSGENAQPGSHSPEGAVPSFEVFEVEGDLLPGQQLILSVMDAEGNPLAEVPPLSETTWRPSPAEREELESLGTILWSYYIKTGASQRSDIQFVEAQLER